MHALVDGANVALFGQNWEHGAFSFGQIKGVMEQLSQHHPDLHPLMVIITSSIGVLVDTSHMVPTQEI